MPDDVKWIIQYRRGNQQNNVWKYHQGLNDNSCEILYEGQALARLKDLRKNNAIRDVERRKLPGCEDYVSVSTNYRLVKVTMEVVDEDRDFDPMV